MPFLILFLLIPVVEIWLFVKIGGIIGAWPTVALVVASGIVGAMLVRLQSLTVLNRARATLAAGEFPTAELFHGLFVLLAGFLLITPGFFTDVIGLLLFIPALRRWLGATIWEWISHRPDIVIHRSHRVVEGTYHEIHPENDQPERPVDRHLGPPTGPTGRSDNLDRR